MTAPETLPPELAELGELLREDPPRPDPGWASALDARARAGFPKPARRSPFAGLKRLRPMLLPAMGVATTVLVVVALASTDLSDDESASGGGSGGSGSSGQTEAADPAAGGGASGGAELRSRQKDSAGDAASSVAPPPAVAPAPGGGSPGSDSRGSRKQERSAALTLAARRGEIERVADGIVRVADAAGGFVATSNVASGGGSFELRIPTSRLQKALADLSRLAHVRERSQATRDITAWSVSARERLREARREREGLLRALARATTLNETESVKARLRTVNARIASAREAVSRVDNRAAYANVSVALVAEEAGSAAPGDDGRWTPADAFDDAVRVLEVVAGIALIVLAVALPLAVLAGLGIAGSRAMGRRRRERALDVA